MTKLEELREREKELVEARKIMRDEFARQIRNVRQLIYVEKNKTKK